MTKDCCREVFCPLLFASQTLVKIDLHNIFFTLSVRYFVRVMKNSRIPSPNSETVNDKINKVVFLYLRTARTPDVSLCRLSISLLPLEDDSTGTKDVKSLRQYTKA